MNKETKKCNFKTPCQNCIEDMVENEETINRIKKNLEKVEKRSQKLNEEITELEDEESLKRKRKSLKRLTKEFEEDSLLLKLLKKLSKPKKHRT